MSSPTISDQDEKFLDLSDHKEFQWPAELFLGSLSEVKSVKASGCRVVFQDGVARWSRPKDDESDRFEDANETDLSVSTVEKDWLFPLHLTKIDLSRCQLSFLPLSFCELKHLESVDLSRNCLEELGSHFASADNLVHVDLSYNKLRILPEWINCLRRARVVRLDHNPIGGLHLLTSDFGKTCKRLHTLNISHCATSDRLSPTVFHAKNLVKLILGTGPSLADEDEGSNVLFSLPREIALVSRLTTLIASGIALSEVPDEMGSLKRLKYLDLSSNNLCWLPCSIHAMERLQVLIIDHNSLDYLPSKIEEMPSLSELRASHNHLSWITEDIWKAKDRLKVLDLYKNNLDLEGAESLKDLYLHEVDLGGNNLSIGEITHTMNMENYLIRQERLRDRLRCTDRQDPVQHLEKNTWTKSIWQSNQDDTFINSDHGATSESDEERNDEVVDAEYFFVNEPKVEVRKPADVTLNKALFPWEMLDKEEGVSQGYHPKSDLEDNEMWDDDTTACAVRKKRPVALTYNFNDMSVWCTGQLQLCPADRHPRAMCEIPDESRQRLTQQQLDLKTRNRPGRQSCYRTLKTKDYYVYDQALSLGCYDDANDSVPE